jgi:hypothetical protein
MIPSFLTHYYEAERGPFKNICDLSDDEEDPFLGLTAQAKNLVCASRLLIALAVVFVSRRVRQLSCSSTYSNFPTKKSIEDIYNSLGRQSSHQAAKHSYRTLDGNVPRIAAIDTNEIPEVTSRRK